MKKELIKLFVILTLITLQIQCQFFGKTEKNDNGLLLALLALNNQGIKVNSAADLAFESNDDYNLNEFGLITTSTLEKWVSNWEANKPKDIRGNLIILQNGSSSAGVIQGNGTNVFSYNFVLDNSNTGFLQTRNNGFVSTVAIIPDGVRTDSLLNIYGIDPVNDLVVLASASSNNIGHYQSTLRAFYALYYWGFDKKHLAVLNGTLGDSGVRGSLPFGANGNTPPNFSNKYSVRQLRTDNTIIQSPLEDVKKLVSNPQDHGIIGIGSGLFIQDARSFGEFQGTHGSGAGYDPIAGTPNSAAGANVTDTRYFGTLKGAVHTPWQELVENSAGYRFKSKAALKSYVLGKGYQAGQTTLQLCRTNYRAQITGFATIAVLGYPTVWYDGGWIEWGNSVSGGGNATLPSGSPFATDSSTYTDRGFHNANANATAKPADLNPSGTTSRQIILDDKAYLRR
ncbi:MAG: rhodanese [Leptospira sp.]|nr:rhodanese [Leptospira sp.]